MKQTTLRAVDANEHGQTKDAQFAEYVARVMENPKTPRMVRNVIQAVVVTDILNNSGYDWITDRDGLSFMLPRLLDGLNAQYKDGITDALVSVIEDLLPREVKQDARLGMPREGARDEN
jgi:hypothetical protein